MKLLSFLHRWSGGLIGLLLAVLGLSGAILRLGRRLDRSSGRRRPGSRARRTARSHRRASAADGAIRITFASGEIGLHHVAREGGAGAYVAQDGVTVASWASQWERPELWLFDLHHHLFAGETGETVTGIAGIFGLLFVITGSILWWRSRRAFQWRLWPKKFQPGPIVAHHRDIGILVAPLLLVTFLTGIGMLFPDAPRGLRSARSASWKRAPSLPRSLRNAVPAPVAAMLAEAKARFPDGRASPPDHPVQARCALFGPPAPAIRMDPQRPHHPVLRRARQAAQGRRSCHRRHARPSINETFYPVHTGKVGGLAWKLAMTLSGLGLTLLGSLTTWSFWFRKAKRRKRPEIASAGLEAAAVR